MDPPSSSKARGSTEKSEEERLGIDEDHKSSLDPPSSSKARGSTEKLEEEELGIDEGAPVTTSLLAHDTESTYKSNNGQSDDVNGDRNCDKGTGINEKVTREDVGNAEHLPNKSLGESQIEGESAIDKAKREGAGKKKNTNGMRKRVTFKNVDLENNCETGERSKGYTPEKLNEQAKLDVLSPNQHELQVASELSNLLSYYGLADPRRSPTQPTNECTYLQFEFFMEMFHKELQNSEAVFQNQVRETTERQLDTIFNELLLTQLKENVNTLSGHQQALEDEINLQCLWMDQMDCAIAFLESCYCRGRMQEDPFRNNIYNSASIINGQVKRACEELAELAAYNKGLHNGPQSSGPVHKSHLLKLKGCRESARDYHLFRYLILFLGSQRFNTDEAVETAVEISTVVAIILENFATISRMEIKVREIEALCVDVSRLHHQFIMAHTHRS